ncbi:protein LNK4-like isoform X2 [Chenopodium quinoa]|uniref:protein LNK4-like isoform X2 n=1 Tax=Chenopodium quinoa TaxID=63459 RepID=UPI000B77E215|nr:protein LNK4-like isoform X2 [Chenopodium quinoa]
MTEWYYGNDGDVVVQRDQEYFDRLPSPDSWSQWETRGIGGNSGWPNTFDSETDSADDIFLSSLLEDDVLPLQSLYIGMPSESDSTNKMMKFQSISCDTDGEGNLTCFTNPNLSCSQSSDNEYSHASKLRTRNNSGRSSCPSVEVPETRDQVPSNHEEQMKTRKLEANDLSSIEESVLMGLETVLNQLSDETRICLRDSMYRLAEHSEQQTSNNAMADEPSLPETSDECSRSRTMEIPESETNVIDRAVAYMMFNKVNENEQEYVPALSPEYVHNGMNFAATRDSESSDLLAQCESYQSDFGAVENTF